ncbi:MAG TPA: YqgE/AlgH family protein [Burkholderiales bacterium]
MRNAGFAALLVLLLGWLIAPASANELERPLALVATPELRDPVYGRTVLLVKPFGRDQHLGFIVNRPTNLTLGKIFPEHGPSQKVPDPVFLGGPFDAGVIFALVARRDSPGGNSVEIAPGLFAAHEAATVDRIIEANPDDARFVAGLVIWRPGELRREIEIGAWQVRDADPGLALRDPKGLWEELVQPSERSRNLLRTGLTR